MNVLERPLRYLAIVCSVFVAAGWVMFAFDQTSHASKTSIAEISGEPVAAPLDPAQIDPTPDQERLREQAHGQVREGIDDVNDVLLRPFVAVAAGSPNDWVRRSVPALLGLLVYGFGLGMLARYMTSR